MTMLFIKYTFLGLVFAVVVCSGKRQLNRLVPDAGLTTEESVKKYGYPFESHNIGTDDGYILVAHRIPYGKGQLSTNQKVVLLMPGLWRSSEVWVNFGPGRSLGFILADAGFDVWIGNYRGTTWSRRHIKLDADQNVEEFWDFSLDELGYYDCPTFISYILQKTNQTNLIYVGETIGASMFFIMSAEQPQYMDRVKLMVAIAPVVDIGKAKNMLYPIMSKYRKQIQELADYFGVYEILKHSRWLNALEIVACSDVILRAVCELVHSIGVGFNSPQLNRTAIPLLLNGFPAGSSLKELNHLTQIYESGVFAKYNYGSVENLKRYGQKEPPIYSLGNITTPVLLYYGGNDAIVHWQGVQRFSTLLPNIIYTKFMADFNNGDFLWAIDVVQLIYKDMVNIMLMF